jgi:hypothetical protein
MAPAVLGSRSMGRRRRIRLCGAAQTLGHGRAIMVGGASRCRGTTQESAMSKGQRGNKEAKKPKKEAPLPAVPSGVSPVPAVATAARTKRR